MIRSQVSAIKKGGKMKHFATLTFLKRVRALRKLPLCNPPPSTIALFELLQSKIIMCENYDLNVSYFMVGFMTINTPGDTSIIKRRVDH